MTRRRPPRKVTYFEPVPPRLARNTIICSAGPSAARQVHLNKRTPTRTQASRPSDPSPLAG